MFVASILINIGMWFERFVIIVTSLHRDFVPSSWGIFIPTFVDVAIFVGTLGIFFFFFLLFMRWLPMVAMAEVKGIMAAADPHYHVKHAEKDEAHSDAAPAAKDGDLAPEGA